MQISQSACLGIIPVVLIAILNWIYAIFLLNRFGGVCAFKANELIALVLYLLGGYAAWISEMCILDDDLVTLQIASSLYRTFCNWIGLVFIINGGLVFTRQQVGSLVFVILIASLWEVQHRIMLNPNEDDAPAN